MRKPTFLHLLSIAIVAAVAFLACSAYALPGDVYETNGQQILRMSGTGATNVTPVTFAIGLANPKGLVFDGTGKLYVADANAGTITVYTVPDGTTGTSFAVNLSSPVGVTFSATGDLYVGEAGTGRISWFDVLTGARTTFATGVGAPAGLVFAENGDLFVSDFEGGKIYHISADGMTKTTFVSGLNLPAGIAFDSSGNLFEADSGSGNIYKIDPTGTKTSFASGLSRPYGVVFDAGGNLFVSDNGNGGTFRFTPDAMRSTVFASNFNTPVFLTIEPVSHQMLNMSTRGFVGSGDHNLIAGFNIGGIGPVGISVAIRALGPSLSASGIADPLADPALEIRDASGALVAFNDNWQDAADAQKISLSVLQPTNPLEAGLQLSLRGGLYTGIVYGANNSTGTCIVEVYNLY